MYALSLTALEFKGVFSSTVYRSNNGLVDTLNPLLSTPNLTFPFNLPPYLKLFSILLSSNNLVSTSVTLTKSLTSPIVWSNSPDTLNIPNCVPTLTKFSTLLYKTGLLVKGVPSCFKVSLFFKLYILPNE